MFMDYWAWIHSVSNLVAQSEDGIQMGLRVKRGATLPIPATRDVDDAEALCNEPFCIFSVWSIELPPIAPY